MLRCIRVAGLAALVAVPAGSAYGGFTCPHGQILRVKMGKCFPTNSPMARAYAYAATPQALARRRISFVLPPPAPPRALTPMEPPPFPFALPDLSGEFGGDADEETRALLLKAMLRKD